MMKRVQTKRQTGRWLKQMLEKSGPTYVKIGQFISNRPDLFGKELSDEVLSLQNKTETFILEETFPNSIRINRNPIASASIAQIHKGVLNDGRLVVVKVKRPDVDKQLIEEISGIRTVLDFFQFFIPEMKSLSEWFRDFEKTVIDELDFINEVKNIQIFEQMYNYDDDILIPRVIKEMSNEKYVVMEYVPSKPLKTTENPLKISENLMNMFIEQILYNGVIHGDLHAGNMGITKDDKIVLYDFGNVIRIPEYYQIAMRRVIQVVQNRDSKGLLESMEQMGMEILDRPAAQEFTKKFFSYVDTLDPKSFSYTKTDIMVPIKLDNITLTILRTYSLVEGVCTDIYAQFTYEQVIQNNLELLILDSFFNS